MDKGYLQVYTGNGKGKTTAAMGLALRALGAGHRVYFGQFMKMGRLSEIRALESFPALTIRQFGDGTELTAPDAHADQQAAQAGLQGAQEALASGEYDLVILDEINVAVHLGHVDDDQLRALLLAQPTGTELVLTGRWARPWLIQQADLVTEMVEVKHYYNAGVPARRGIEL